LIVLLIFSVIWWVLTMIPLPPPVAQVVRVVVAVLMLVWLVYALLPYAGYGVHPMLR
jgi:hypothetical protein